MTFEEELALKMSERVDFLFKFIAQVATDDGLDYVRRKQQIDLCLDQIDGTFLRAKPKLVAPTPIEDKFAKAVAVGSFHCVGWHLWVDVSEAIDWGGLMPPSDPIFGVAHQVMVPRPCGRHFRVDFLFVAPNFGNSHDPFLIAVECDGHDFHEKTKEQAAADKARDRELVAAGITVLRFTGSEIWKDEEKCAQEVEALLWARCHGTISRPTQDATGEAVDG